MHAVGHVKAAILAHRLHFADDLTGIALADQIAGQVRIEHDGHAAVGLRNKAGLLRRAGQHVDLLEHNLVAVHVELHQLAAGERVDNLVAVHRGQRFADTVEQLAVLLAQRTQLRLERIRGELPRIVHETDGLHIQLIARKRGEILREGNALDVQRRGGLANLHIRHVAAGAAGLNDLEQRFHVLLQLRVHVLLLVGGEIAEMHALRRVLIRGTHEVLIHILGHERRIRRKQLAQRHEHVIERGERGFLAAFHALAPEALAAAADVPVGQLVHKRGDGAAGLGDLIGFQPLVDKLDERVELGEQPLIHQRQLDGIERVRLGIEVIDVRVQNKERVRIPQRTHELALHLSNGVGAEAAGQPRRADGIEIPADGVRALLVQHLAGRNDIAQMLGHLAAFHILHMTEDEAVFKRRTVEQQRRDGQQGIEPAACLVDGLRDELRRVKLLKALLILKGIMPLRERHRAGIEPAVAHFLHAMHFLAAVRAGDRHRVDVGAMQLDILGHVMAHFPQLFDGADHVHMTFRADPDGQRGAPIALARDAPVNDVLQEVAHAAFLDILRHPVDGTVVGDQLIAHGGHLDEPGFARVVQKRRVAAPAEGVIMRELHRLDEVSALLELGEDIRIAILDEAAFPLRALGKAALRVHQLHERQVVGMTHAAVVFAERGRDMDDAHAVGQRDIAVGNDIIRLLIRMRVPQRLVLHAHKRLTLDGFELFGLLVIVAQDGLHQRVGHDGDFVAQTELRVILVGVDAQRDVGRQRPRRGRPCPEIFVLRSLDAEADERGFFLYVLIALGHFVAGEGGTAARAVGDDLMSLIKQTLIVDLLHRPPFAFDVIVMVGDVGMLHVAPVADGVAHLFPFVQVFPDGLLAGLDERLDAVLLDLLLAVEAELLFNLQLDRQAVGIPAGLTQDGIALHRAIARDEVFHRAGQDMADMRLAVRGRRAVIERIVRAPVAQRQGFLKNIVLLPESEHFFFAPEEVEIRFNLIEHLIPPYPLTVMDDNASIIRKKRGK